jgi:UDP-N-acetylmuramate dehydrogenase
VGGPADLFFTPRDVMDLAAFMRQLPPDLPLLWIGLGSNLLVRDGGIRGAVIATHGALGGLERLSATRIQVEAGVPCGRIARQCVKWGLGPAEFFAGIPGTSAAHCHECRRPRRDLAARDRRRRARPPRRPPYAQTRISTSATARWWGLTFIGAQLSSRAPAVNTNAIRELLEKRAVAAHR